MRRKWRLFCCGNAFEGVGSNEKVVSGEIDFGLYGKSIDLIEAVKENLVVLAVLVIMPRLAEGQFCKPDSSSSWRIRHVAPVAHLDLGPGAAC